MTLRRHWPMRGRPRLAVRRPAALLFCLSAALAADHTGILRLGLLCAALHECGHLAVWLALIPAPPRLTLSITGLCLSMRGIALPPGQELALAAAGPAVNLLLGAGAVLWMQQTAAGYRLCYFAAANLLLAAFNLLPLPGLDGAHMVQATRDMELRTLKKPAHLSPKDRGRR